MSTVTCPVCVSVHVIDPTSPASEPIDAALMGAAEVREIAKDRIERELHQPRQLTREECDQRIREEWTA